MSALINTVANNSGGPMSAAADISAGALHGDTLAHAAPSHSAHAQRQSTRGMKPVGASSEARSIADSAVETSELSVESMAQPGGSEVVPFRFTQFTLD
jgi:hypothetical protein